MIINAFIDEKINKIIRKIKFQRANGIYYEIVTNIIVLQETKEEQKTHVLDKNVVKELEFVKLQVLKLEEDLEKQKTLYEKQKSQYETQSEVLAQTQRKLDQEIDTNKKMSWVTLLYLLNVNRM